MTASLTSRTGCAEVPDFFQYRSTYALIFCTDSGLGRAEFNPIERIGILAKAKVPACFIHGDDDKVVPLNENSKEFVARYKAAGAEDAVKLIVAEGQGHNFWEGFFRCRELIDFAI